MRHHRRPTPSVCRLALLLVLSVSLPLYAEAEDVAPACQAVTTPQQPARETPEQLESRNAKIGEIRVVTNNLFNPCEPKEDRALHRLANKLHIKTRPDVVAAQLLFESGDLYSEQRTEETERLLRSNRYLKDAEITHHPNEDGTVDLDVRTTDVWTLAPSMSFGRSGGVNTYSIGLKEFNLLGRGKRTSLHYKSDIDRDSTIVLYDDTNVLGSRYKMFAQYADTSDGFAQQFSLERPFYALDVRRAGGVSFNNIRQTESLYDRGDITSQFEHSFDQYSGYLGWSPGLRDNWVRRLIAGVAYDNHEFGPPPESDHPTADLPPDREFLYPFVGLQLLSNDFVETRNFDQMNRVEDRYLGRHFFFRVGYSSEDAGSTANAWHLLGRYGDTLYRSASSTIVVNTHLAGRIEDGKSKNMKLTIGGRYDLRQTPKWAFHVRATGTYGTDLDIDNPTYLGGDSGLRGYPLRYQTGDKSFLLTVEQRLFTNWYPFRLFNVGAAAFFDAGRTWGEGPTDSKNLGWLRDVGVGLRIGNTHSSLGRMVHIDLAYPLDGEADIDNVQIVVRAKTGF